MREQAMAAAPNVPTARTLNLLVVAPYRIFPAWTGGSIRIVELSRQIAKLGHNVTVLTPWHPRQKPLMDRDEHFSLRQAPYPFLLQRAFTDRPFPFLYLMSIHPGLRFAVASLLRTHDAIQFENVSFAGLIKSIPKRTVVGYDAQNVDYDYVRHECHSSRIAEIVGRRIHRLERELVGRSGCVFPVSSLDQERMSSLYGLQTGQCTLAPNGIHVAREATADPAAMLRRFPRIKGFRTRAIFSGSNVDHNRRAVAFLLEHVAPSAPDVGFVVHGTCAIPFGRHCSLSNVFFDADLGCRSFAEYAVTDMIGLNAVETGGGTNLKLLQYLSHGLPVLSTRFGMRGYEDLTAYVRVEDRDAFAAALVDGCFPPPPPPSLLLDRYSWSTIAARMAQAYIRQLR